jgi:predicted site-specific integrase-resolvase
MDDPEVRLATAKDVAAVMGFSVKTVWRWIREGRMKVHNSPGGPGGRPRYRIEVDERGLPIPPA